VAVLRQPPETHGRRTNVLLEALKISGNEQLDDPRFPSKKPPALARVLTADMKSEAHEEEAPFGSRGHPAV
jgi:hypothetical protein